VHRSGGHPPGIGANRERSTICGDLDVAVEIGAQYGSARQGGQRFRGRMPVLVAGARRDDGDGRPRRIQEPRRGGRGGAVMPDLEDVHGRHQPAADEEGLDRSLRITGQQRGELAVADEDDDRSIVDVALGKRGCRIGLSRVQDFDVGGRIKFDPLSGSGDCHRRSRAGRIGQDAVVCGVGKRDSRVDDGSHPEPLEHLDQPCDVVLVWMTEDEDVDVASEERKVRT
jgi:hypothetical protein